VSPLLKLEGGINRELLTVGLPPCLGPPGLPWVPLFVEVPSTFTGAKVENFGVVPDESDSVARVHRF